MLTEMEVQALQNEKNEWQAKIKAKEAEKQELYNNNKEKIDERAKYQKQAKLFRTAAIAGGIVVLFALVFVRGIAGKIILMILGAALAVGAIVMYKKPADAIKALSEVLADCDKAEAGINTEIDKYTSAVQKIDSQITRYETEKKYEQYVKNHICVFVGESTDITTKTPRETSYRYEEPVEAIVYIDGVEYGQSSKPFEAFEVTPGTHVIKIKAYTKWGGKNGLDMFVESKAHQVKVTENSMFVFYHWSFCEGRKGGVAHDLFLKTYDNLHDFLEATHAL